MTPTIVVRGGAVVAVAGASGGPFIISATTQTILNALELDMDAATAVAAPRLHHQWMPPVLMLESGLSGTMPALARMGHKTTTVAGIGAVQLARRKVDGSLDGAADPRKGGAVAGW
jgi:gamma-glutamyltranspeptidase/glutathione hydrolase